MAERGRLNNFEGVWRYVLHESSRAGNNSKFFFPSLAFNLADHRSPWALIRWCLVCKYLRKQITFQLFVFTGYLMLSSPKYNHLLVFCHANMLSFQRCQHESNFQEQDHTSVQHEDNQWKAPSNRGWFPRNGFAQWRCISTVMHPMQAWKDFSSWWYGVVLVLGKWWVWRVLQRGLGAGLSYIPVLWWMSTLSVLRALSQVLVPFS